MRRRSIRIDGRVTSIQIEDAYWRLLKRQAAEAGETLSALLGRLRREAPDEANFTAALRLACLSALQQRLAARDAELAELRAAGGDRDVLTLLALVEAPMVLLDGERTVVGRSGGFLHWLGVPAAAVDGRPLDVLVARGSRDGLVALWQRRQMATAGATVSEVLNLVVAGRVRIVRLSLRATSGGGAFGLF